MSSSENQTKEIAEKLASSLRAPATVCLFGDLGAGKTVFCKGFAAALGINERDLKSPTFTFIRKYPLEKFNLYHCDFYRVEHIDDIIGHNLNELFQEKDAVVLIEWAERVEHLIPPSSIKVRMAYVDPSHRKIQIEYPD